MASITIRDVPARTHKGLVSRAARKNLSLQEYLRSQLIELERRPDVDEVFARIRARQGKTGSTLTSAQILEYRDRGRR
jgi:hypothetical protein